MNSLHLHKIYSDIMSVDIKDDFQSILRSLSTLLIINITVPTHGMRIKVICYKLHTLSLKLQQLHIHTSSCFQTLNLLHVSICKMFLFWDVSHETKQKKNSNKLQRVCSLDGKSYSTVTWSTQFSKSVAQGNLWALRDRLCPRTNMQAFLCPNEGWCFYYPSIIFHNMCSWKLGNVTQISSVLAGEYSVMWCIRPVAWTHKIIFDGL